MDVLPFETDIGRERRASIASRIRFYLCYAVGKTAQRDVVDAVPCALRGAAGESERPPPPEPAGGALVLRGACLRRL